MTCGPRSHKTPAAGKSACSRHAPGLGSSRKRSKRASYSATAPKAPDCTSFFTGEESAVPTAVLIDRHQAAALGGEVEELFGLSESWRERLVDDDIASSFEVQALA